MADAVPRPISDDDWIALRHRLIFYFSHHGCVNPEDLAQETITRLLVWFRKGQEIKGENGLARLAFGFARNILRESRVADQKAPEPLEDDIEPTVYRERRPGSAETAVFVKEILTQLTDNEQ